MDKFIDHSLKIIHCKTGADLSKNVTKINTVSEYIVYNLFRNMHNSKTHSFITPIDHSEMDRFFKFKEIFLKQKVSFMGFNFQKQNPYGFRILIISFINREYSF